VRLFFLALALLAVPAYARIGDEPLPAWAQPEGAEPVRVGEIVFEGADAKALRAVVSLKEGAPLDARDVRDAVRALHAEFELAADAVQPERPFGAVA
jgi:hypothetical protein